MDRQTALKIIWNYMHIGHHLEKADVIVALGTHDIRVPEYAAKLWLDGWAPYLVCSGSGTIHRDEPAWKQFSGRPEAEVFAEIAIKLGVSPECVVIENQSQNTGANYEYTGMLLAEKGIKYQKVIVVHKPYMERRAFATGRVCWPETELIVVSPPISFEDYPNEIVGQADCWTHTMVGDLERIIEYPKFGYQIAQEVPQEVWEAFQFLIKAGFTDCLIKISTGPGNVD